MNKKGNKNEHKHEHKHTITLEEALEDGVLTDDEFNHLDKRSHGYKELVKKYKKRNRLAEIIIACVVILALFFALCNRTFLKTEYKVKVGNSNINIELPRFTFFIGKDDEKIIFKTLRKSENTRAFFDSFLESGRFDVYLCGEDKTPYYYDREGKYFIFSIDVEKKFVVKTVTVNYSTVDKDLLCKTVEKVEK